jgi:hypothetical protein
MPTQSLTIDSGILTNIGFIAGKEKRDGLALESGVLAALKKALGNPANRRWDTGGRYSSGLAVVEHSTATDQAASGGWAPLSGTVYEPERALIYTLADTNAPVMASGYQARIYDSTKAFNTFWQGRAENVMSMLHRRWSRQIVAGGSAGFASWNTLNGVDSSVATNAGFIEDDAFGSQTNSFGGLPRGSFPTVPGCQNQVQSGADAFGSNGANGMFSLATGCRRHKNGGNKVWLGSDQGMNNLKRSALAYERFTSKDSLDLGREVSIFNGSMIFHEPQMPISTATGGSSTNTNPITFYYIDVDDIFPVWANKVNTGGIQLGDGYFGTSGVAEQISGNQLAWCMSISCSGQLVALDVGSSGLLHSAETF